MHISGRFFYLGIIIVTLSRPRGCSTRPSPSHTNWFYGGGTLSGAVLFISFRWLVLIFLFCCLAVSLHWLRYDAIRYGMVLSRFGSVWFGAVRFIYPCFPLFVERV